MSETEKPSNEIKNSGRFIKGRKKTGGRKKNTPNKNTLKVGEILESKGINVVEELLIIVNTTDKIELKVNILLKLMPYVYPQFRAIEGSLNINNNSMAEFMQGLAKVKK